MLLVLQREPSSGGRTFGLLSVGHVPFCHTLEDEVRPPGVKVRGVTAIPPGLYRLSLSWSPRFKEMLPLIEEVPMFEGIRIHAGNRAEDTEGCVLVGEEREGDELRRSRAALERLLGILKGPALEGEMFIDVRNPQAVRATPEVQ